MSTNVSDRLRDLSAINQELIQLAVLENPSAKQIRRMADLKSALNAIKAGSTLQEVRAYELEELRREAQLPRLPDKPRTALGEEIESEYRKFALGQPYRETYIPPAKETRANEAGTQTLSFTEPTVGGYFVAPGMHDRFLQTMKQFDQVFEPWAHYDIQTQTGGVMAVPAADDVSVQSVQVSEATQSAEADIYNFGNVELSAYTFRSKVVAFSLELLQDTNFGVAETFERIFASRHALGFGNSICRGSGVASPTGLLTATVASGASAVIATGSASNTGGSESGSTSWGTNDAFTLFKKLDPALRPGAVWCMQDATLQYLASLLDKIGDPIFPNQLLGDGKDVYLLGHRVAISPSMPALAAGANSVVFYQPNYFCVRTVPRATYIRRYSQNPTLILSGLFGFESFLRGDSNLVCPNVNYLPAQYLQQHS